MKKFLFIFTLALLCSARVNAAACEGLAFYEDKTFNSAYLPCLSRTDIKVELEKNKTLFFHNAIDSAMARAVYKELYKQEMARWERNPSMFKPSESAAEENFLKYFRYNLLKTNAEGKDAFAAQFARKNKEALRLLIQASGLALSKERLEQFLYAGISLDSKDFDKIDIWNLGEKGTVFHLPLYSESYAQLLFSSYYNYRLNKDKKETELNAYAKESAIKKEIALKLSVVCKDAGGRFAPDAQSDPKIAAYLQAKINEGLNDETLNKRTVIRGVTTLSNGKEIYPEYDINFVKPSQNKDKKKN